METLLTSTRDGVRLVFREQAGAEPALMLVHGLSSTKNIWNRVLPLLGGRRAISYDQRGHGESDKPEAGYGFAETTADLDALMTTAGLERAVLVGHSWGANVALEFAALHPKRAQGLVLIDGGFNQLSARPGMSRERALEMLRPPDIDGLPVGELLARIEAHMPVWDEEVREIILASFFVSDEGKISRRFPVPQHMQVVEALWEQKPMDLMPLVECPVLLMPAYMDGGDGVAERMAAKREGVGQALRLLRDGRLAAMDDTIHDVPLQRPAELAAALENFVATLGPVANHFRKIEV